MHLMGLLVMVLLLEVPLLELEMLGNFYETYTHCMAQLVLQGLESKHHQPCESTPCHLRHVNPRRLVHWYGGGQYA